MAFASTLYDWLTVVGTVIVLHTLIMLMRPINYHRSELIE